MLHSDKGDQYQLYKYDDEYSDSDGLSDGLSDGQ